MSQRIGRRWVYQWLVVLLSSLAFVSHSQTTDETDVLTPDARNLVDWIVHSFDHQNLPFIVVDKKAARIFVYRSDGRLLGAAPALLGVAVGDHTVPGVGDKRLADIRFEERTTPAGRFVADLGFDLRKEEILWIDYDSGLSLHTVITSNVKERRQQRLASTESADLRITYGCINVAGRFYKEVVYPTFQNTSGIIYILPEIHSIRSVFGAEAGRYAAR